MTVVFNILAVAALASIVVSVPMEFFKRDTGSLAVLALCLPPYATFGIWPYNCKEAAAKPGLISAVTLDKLSVDFTGTDSWAPLVSSSGITVTLRAFSGFTLPIKSVRTHITVFDGDVELGSIETSSNPARASGAIVSTTFTPVPWSVPPTAHGAFADLVKALFATKSKNVRFTGTADVTFDLGLGQKTLPGIGFESTNPFLGLSGMTDITYASFIGSANVNANKKSFTYKVNIKGASNLSVKIGDVVFNTVNSDGKAIGTTTLEALSLEQGDNIVTAVTTLDLSLSDTTAFVGALSQGEVALTHLGFDNSSQNKAILSALQSLRISFSVPKNFGASA